MNEIFRASRQDFGLSAAGFCMEFDTGYAVSVQWGWMNYCDNRSLSRPVLRDGKSLECANAEILLMYNGEGVGGKDLNSHFLDFADKIDYYGICGYLTPSEVAKLLFIASRCTEPPVATRRGEQEEEESVNPESKL